MKIKIVKVAVVFELEFDPGQEDLVPRLVGSLEELGTWNCQNGIDARQNDQDSTKWIVELEIPQMSFFFFNWTMTKNGRFYEEEAVGCRNANVGVFGGIFQSEYGAKRTEFTSFCGCQVSVTTHYVLNDDEQIAVVGSGDFLGNWKTTVPATSHDPLTSLWTAKFEQKQGTVEEFKWIILDKQTREIRRWQDGENRLIKIENGVKNKTMFFPWGGRFLKEGITIPVVTVEDLGDYRPSSLSRDFTVDNLTGYDDTELQTNNSNITEPNLGMEWVPKIPSRVGEQFVVEKFQEVADTEHFSSITMDSFPGELELVLDLQYHQ